MNLTLPATIIAKPCGWSIRVPERGLQLTRPDGYFNGSYNPLFLIDADDADFNRHRLHRLFWIFTDFLFLLNIESGLLW